jgi:hypothetical protein
MDDDVNIALFHPVGSLFSALQFMIYCRGLGCWLWLRLWNEAGQCCGGGPL